MTIQLAGSFSRIWYGEGVPTPTMSDVGGTISMSDLYKNTATGIYYNCIVDDPENYNENLQWERLGVLTLAEIAQLAGLVSNFPSSITGRTWKNNTGSTTSGTRAIVTANNAANGFQLSTTKEVDARYNITLTISPTLLAAASRTVTAYTAATNSTNSGDWTELDTISFGIPAGITLSNVTSRQTLIIDGIPVGYFIRLLETSTGSGSSTLNRYRERT